MKAPPRFGGGRPACVSRRQWPVREFELGAEPARDALDRSTVDQRIAIMWSLAREAWAVAGKPIPKYERRDMPGAVFRRKG